jgi:hypothetical protein
MQADLPIYESPEDAVRAAMQALGGSKKVGPMIWPAINEETASRKLLDCLNPLRAEKLDLAQNMFILRAARDAGHYAPFQWVAGECGFDAKPISQDENIDRLTSVIESTARTLANATAALERMQRTRQVA